MRKKISNFFVCMLLIVTAFFSLKINVNGNISQQISNGTGIFLLKTNEEIFKEIDKIQDKILKVDRIIGDKHVKYWEHVINDILVKKDTILLHLDPETGDILKYEKQWSDIELILLDFEDRLFEPNNYFWKQKIVFQDESTCSNFYTFYEPPTYPLICWEVRHENGETIMYDFRGNTIGAGIPAPSDHGFSLTGYCSDISPDCWIEWRENADSWFSKWFNSTDYRSLPTVNEISSYINDSDVKYFYEIAHSGGLPNRFQANAPGVYYTADHLRDDMNDRDPMKLAVICSCEGMRSTGPNTLSYEFRKGALEDAVTIGYIGMSSCPGWSVSLPWQNSMFENMSNGLTMQEAFNMASARYPLIANCVKFIGDQNLKLPFAPQKPVRPIGPSSGKLTTMYNYSTSSIDPNGDQIYYWFNWSDGTYTGWDGPYDSEQTATVTHIWQSQGNYSIRVKAKDTVGKESPWSDPLIVTIMKNKAAIKPLIHQVVRNLKVLFPSIDRLLCIK